MENVMSLSDQHKSLTKALTLYVQLTKDIFMEIAAINGINGATYFKAIGQERFASIVRDEFYSIDPESLAIDGWQDILVSSVKKCALRLMKAALGGS